MRLIHSEKWKLGCLLIVTKLNYGLCKTEYIVD